jgi:hypothetical protein
MNATTTKGEDPMILTDQSTMRPEMVGVLAELSDEMDYRCRVLQEAQAWAGRDAELAATAAARRILGADLAGAITWARRPNGTAAGELAGLAVEWAPPADRYSPETLTVSCPTCAGVRRERVASAAELVEVLARCPQSSRRRQ